jgi:hypothetical protein
MQPRSALAVENANRRYTFRVIVKLYCFPCPFQDRENRLVPIEQPFQSLAVILEAGKTLDQIDRHDGQPVRRMGLMQKGEIFKFGVVGQAPAIEKRYDNRFSITWLADNGCPSKYFSDNRFSVRR